MSFTQSQFEFLDDKAQSANILAEGALSKATSAETKADNALLLNLTDILQNGNTASTPILLQNGTAALPGLAFQNSTNTGIFSPSAGNLQITTNGISRITIQAGPITLGNSSQLRIGNAAAIAVPTNPSLTFNNDLDTGIFSPGADQLGISTGGVERVRVSNDTTLFNNKIVIKSPNGNGWEIYVDDAGNLLTRLAFEVS